MAPRVVDEREHRRGLILGLTLAEVLLLILFLVMLTFSIPLKGISNPAPQVAGPGADIEQEIARLKRENDDLRSIIAQAGGAGTSSELASLIMMAREFKEALAGTQITPSDLKQILLAIKTYAANRSGLQDLKALLEMTRKINPDDPPASVRRATSFLKAAGSDLTPEQVSALSPLLNSGLKLGAFEKPLEEAFKRNPEDPASVLKRGLEIDDEAMKYLGIAKVLSQVKGFPTDPDLIMTLIKSGLRGEHNWPPIINLTEAGGYYFKTGSAELAGDFDLNLQTRVIPQLMKLAQEYSVDTIEVIGHTDEQAIAQRNSNLDTSLLGVLNGGQISAVTPADNAGLGLSRAVAVVKSLAGDERLAPFRSLPLSGGQLISVDERITKGVAGSIKERRRIEIRLRRFQDIVGSITR